MHNCFLYCAVFSTWLCNSSQWSCTLFPSISLLLHWTWRQAFWSRAQFCLPFCLKFCFDSPLSPKITFVRSVNSFMFFFSGQGCSVCLQSVCSVILRQWEMMMWIDHCNFWQLLTHNCVRVFNSSVKMSDWKKSNKLCQKMLHGSYAHFQTLFELLSFQKCRIVHIENIMNAISHARGYSWPWVLYFSHEHNSKK